MYAGDERAQRLALEALDRGLDRGMRAEERMFLHMPLLHAESLELQRRNSKETQRLYDDFPDQQKFFSMSLEQAGKYLGIIEKYGRFPHRNAIHGRESTAEEKEFLKDWAEKMAPKGFDPKKG
jgi:uncharacterized protein (DUF924 family)